MDDLQAEVRRNMREQLIELVAALGVGDGLEAFVEACTRHADTYPDARLVLSLREQIAALFPGQMVLGPKGVFVLA